MDEVALRTPRDDDWQAILDLAHQSLAELPNAPSQQPWLDNRRSFSPAEGIQQHFVACRRRSNRRLCLYRASRQLEAPRAATQSRRR